MILKKKKLLKDKYTGKFMGLDKQPGVMLENRSAIFNLKKGMHIYTNQYSLRHQPTLTLLTV